MTVLNGTFVYFYFIFDVQKALKKSVDFTVQCVLLEHVMLFSYYAKTKRTQAHGQR